mmetsp:Transcript_15077/g.56842  ORF Transcript_15077/g.56842 Transcript_15077/m.56842 type:complete len:505 (-) Transcript_15077:547-2061(-)
MASRHGLLRCARRAEVRSAYCGTPNGSTDVSQPKSLITHPHARAHTAAAPSHHAHRHPRASPDRQPRPSTGQLRSRHVLERDGLDARPRCLLGGLSLGACNGLRVGGPRRHGHSPSPHAHHKRLAVNRVGPRVHPGLDRGGASAPRLRVRLPPEVGAVGLGGVGGTIVQARRLERPPAELPLGAGVFGQDPRFHKVNGRVRPRVALPACGRGGRQAGPRVRHGKQRGRAAGSGPGLGQEHRCHGHPLRAHRVAAIHPGRLGRRPGVSRDERSQVHGGHLRLHLQVPHELRRRRCCRQRRLERLRRPPHEGPRCGLARAHKLLMVPAQNSQRGVAGHQHARARRHVVGVGVGVGALEEVDAGQQHGALRQQRQRQLHGLGRGLKLQALDALRARRRAVRAPQGGGGGLGGPGGAGGGQSEGAHCRGGKRPERRQRLRPHPHRLALCLHGHPGLSQRVKPRKDLRLWHAGLSLHHPPQLLNAGLDVLAQGGNVLQRQPHVGVHCAG